MAKEKTEPTNEKDVRVSVRRYKRKTMEGDRGRKKGPPSRAQHHTPSYLIQGAGLLCLAGPGPLRSIPPTKELLLAIPINIASFSSLPHSQALVQASKTSSLQHGCYYFFPSSPYRDHCFVPRDHATFITVQRPTGVYFR